MRKEAKGKEVVIISRICLKPLILLTFLGVHLWCIFLIFLLSLSSQQGVFCSDMTFDATVNPVVYEGGVPIFIDTEYDTWNIFFNINTIIEGY